MQTLYLRDKEHLILYKLLNVKEIKLVRNSPQYFKMFN